MDVERTIIQQTEAINRIYYAASREGQRSLAHSISFILRAGLNPPETIRRIEDIVNGVLGGLSER